MNIYRFCFQNLRVVYLYFIFQALARGFEQLLAFDGDVMSVYERTFTVEREVLGERLVVELKPSGADIVLTAENRQGNKTKGTLEN